MTVSDVLKTIHRKYEGDTNYPTSGEDFNLRMGLINDAILEWESVENTRWKELIEKKTGTTDGTNQIACPSDFVDIMSQLKIGNDVYGFQKPDEARRLLMAGNTDKFFFISGQPEDYKLNVNPTPDNNLSYEYYYYKRAPIVSSGSDKIIVPKPLFVVYSVLKSLYELDNLTSFVSLYEQKAYDQLSEMIVQNEAVGGLVSNSLLDNDINYKLYGKVLGE